MSRYTRPITEADLTAGLAEARLRVTKQNGKGYVAEKAIRLPGGWYRCACSDTCTVGVLHYGTVSEKCGGGEYAAVRARKEQEDGLLARMRARNAGKKPRAA